MAKYVYFCFDYEDVSDFRANVVRNHNIIDGGYKKGFFDGSIWEDAKKKDPAALRKLIDAELEGTTVTVPLIGSGTYARRWVRYEIFRSVYRGNKLLGVHVNSIKGKDGLTKTQGPNPFEYLALQYNSNGTAATPREWNGNAWIDSPDMPAYSLNQQAGAEYWSKFVQLSTWYPVYDWIANDGYNNFNKWIE